MLRRPNGNSFASAIPESPQSYGPTYTSERASNSHSSSSTYLKNRSMKGITSKAGKLFGEGMETTQHSSNRMSGTVATNRMSGTVTRLSGTPSRLSAMSNIALPENMVHNVGHLLDTVDTSSRPSIQALQKVQALLDKLLAEFKNILSDKLRVLNENTALCKELSSYHSYVSDSRGTSPETVKSALVSPTKSRDIASISSSLDLVLSEDPCGSVRSERVCKEGFPPIGKRKVKLELDTASSRDGVSSLTASEKAVISYGMYFSGEEDVWEDGSICPERQSISTDMQVIELPEIILHTPLGGVSRSGVTSPPNYGSEVDTFSINGSWMSATSPPQKNNVGASSAIGRRANPAGQRALPAMEETSVEHYPSSYSQVSKYSSGNVMQEPIGNIRDSFASWKSDDGPEAFFPHWWNPQSNKYNPFRSHGKSVRIQEGDFQSYLSDGGAKHDLVFSPISIYRLTWDVFAAIFLFCDIWLTPFELLFLSIHRLPLAAEVIRWAIVIFFTLDIFINFNTGYIHKDTVISDRRKLVYHYVRHWFLLDVCATMPSARILDALGFDARGAIVLKGLRMLKIRKYITVLRLLQLLKTVKESGKLHLVMLSRMRWLLKALSYIITFTCVVHINACILRVLGTGRSNASDFQSAFEWYLDYFAVAYEGIVGGVSIVGLGFERTTRVRIVEMLFIAEHVFFLIGLITYCGFKIQVLYGEAASREVLKRDCLAYLNRHDVSVHTQMQVLFGLKEGSNVKAMQKRFNNVMESDLPGDLRFTIIKELWAKKLRSLGLFKMIDGWSDDFSSELSQHCREEVLATNMIVFVEGEASHSACYILQGEVSTSSCLSVDIAIPDFKDGMWFGENALVNSSFRRGFTARAKALCSLLLVPSDELREVLMLFGLLETFEEWCRTQLWRGLCGRCGSVGDHFSDTCWRINGPGRMPLSWKERNSKQWQGLGSQTRATKSISSLRSTFRAIAPNMPERMGSFPQISRAASFVRSLGNTNQFAFKSQTSGDYKSTDESGSGRKVERDLQQFLRNTSVFFLEDHFATLDICTLEELEELDLDFFCDQLANQTPCIHLTPRQKADLHPEKVQAFRRRMNREMQKLFERQAAGNDQHLVFLSHYKVEAGTEAALMRSELERIIKEDKNSPGHDFDIPVFLDSEDLKSLKDLKERVKRSHNIVLLLTTGVLSRPWCLVEIVTAVEMGVRVLLVDVNKKGNEFKFPDRAWFSDLRAGSVLDEVDKSILDSCGIDIAAIEFSVHEVFKSIALPYSPHKPESIRKAELVTLLGQCNVRRDKRMRSHHAARSAFLNRHPKHSF